MDVTLADPLLGREVDGRYLVEARIARGGMSTVYLALDRRLDREVALKVMHTQLAADEHFVSRFVREAQSAARLSHPHVVQVFDQGAAGQVLYLAMEYLPGRTLRDVLVERSALTPRECSSVLDPVLGALAAAHRAGIVHRDVKPENVLLADDGRIKVADFGLAGAVGRPFARPGAGPLLGTAAYVAPELVGRGVADARADVYACGVMLFELLTGTQPFSGDALDVSYQHLHEVVPEPSAVAPMVPVAFDPVVRHATDADPDARPADADQMLQEFRAAMAQVPADRVDRRARPLPATTRSAPVRRTVVASDVQPTQALGTAAAAGWEPAESLVPRLPDVDADPGSDGGWDRGGRRGRSRGVYAFTAGLLVVGAVLLGAFWWLTAGPGAYTGTPPLVGERVADARATLAARGLRADVVEEFSTTVAAGQVISTDPSGGARVKKDGQVLLRVSKGPELIAVPPVKGQPLGDAQALIEQQGLGVGKVTRRYSDTVRAGDVISSSPAARSKVSPDREVDLVVSRGRQQVELPDVVTLPLDQARPKLVSAGLKVSVVEVDYFEGAPAAGTVISQDPAAITPGQKVDKGARVTLTVVKADPSQGVVPDVRGQDFDAARTTLEGLGFRARRLGLPFGGTVRAQNVTGPARLGTEVVLFVGP